MNKNTIKYVLLSTNDNPLYIQFWPLVASAWKKMGAEPLLSLVTDKPYTEWSWMEEYGKIYQFPVNHEIPEKNWSTFCRFYLYYLNLDDISIVSDMDMIPLNGEYLLNLPEGFSDTDNLLVKGYDAYIQQTNHLPDNGPAGPSSFPKFPGCYMIAKGSTWKQIINPNNLEFNDLAKSFYNLNVFQNEKNFAEALNHPNFDEESIIRYLTWKWCPDRSKIIPIKRFSEWIPTLSDRVDRSYWNIDNNKLQSNQYIDCHSLRPLEEYTNSIMPLVNYLGLDPKLIDLGIQKSKI